MFHSLRGRLLAWYAFVLIAAVGGFAVILYSLNRSTRFEQVDARLVSATEYLDVVLRSFPPFLLDQGGDGPRRPIRGPEPKAKDKDRSKRDRDRDRPPPDDFDPEGLPPEFMDFEPPPRRDVARPRERSREQAMGELTYPSGMSMSPEQKDRPYFAVWLGDGKILKSDNWAGHERGAPAPDALGGSPILTTRGEFREAMMAGPRLTRILVGQPVIRELNDIRMFAWQLALAGLGVVAIGLAGGWVVASRVVRPIEAMSQTAAAISAEDMTSRIDTEHIDAELAGLAGSLNAAFDRLASAFTRQTQFTADASHELRTPLAVMRTNTELALNKERSAEEYRNTLNTCLQAAKRMSSIVDGLLTLVRSDAATEVPKRPLQLDQIATDVVESLRGLAKSLSVNITTDVQPIQVIGDPDGLTRLVTNLVSNAIKFNRSDGTISVSVRPAKDGADLIVSDSGMGIPEEDLSNIFERFYRVDKARARATGGAGLGLAICKQIVESHGGTINVSSQPGNGTTFTVHLPTDKTV